MLPRGPLLPARLIGNEKSTLQLAIKPVRVNIGYTRCERKIHRVFVNTPRLN